MHCILMKFQMVKGIHFLWPQNHPCNRIFGFAAADALAVHLYFSVASLSVLFFPNTVYNPITPSQLPLHEISDLYLLDFFGPPGFIHDASSRVDRVVVLDHHKTTAEKLSETPTGENVSKVMDIESNGATIALDYFKEKLIGLKLPNQTVYIEDGDLWRWRLHNSKAFNGGLKDLGIEYDVQLYPSLFLQVIKELRD